MCYISNLLKDNFPEIFSQINIEKTLEKYPNINLNKITCGCDKKFVWHCHVCGFSYEQTVKDKTRKHYGCPICNNKKIISGYNDLHTWCIKNNRKDILDEWDPSNTVKITEISRNYNHLVKFICKCGHHYEQTVCDKTNKSTTCPYCTNQKVLPGYNDLKTWCYKNNREDILKDWVYDKNLCKPENITPFSNKYIWFNCPVCHGNYGAVVSNKTARKCGCPYCTNYKALSGFNDLQTKYPDIAAEWDYERNYPLTPDKVMPGCNKKYWWICKNHHSYSMSPLNRTARGSGCPKCHSHSSKPELLIYKVCNCISIKKQNHALK